MPADPLKIALKSVHWTTRSIMKAAKSRSPRTQRIIAKIISGIVNELNDVVPKTSESSRTKQVAKAKRICRTIGKRILSERRSMTPEEHREFAHYRRVALDRRPS